MEYAHFFFLQAALSNALLEELFQSFEASWLQSELYNNHKLLRLDSYPLLLASARNVERDSC